ncbi:MAG: glycosyltransferase family 39 protein [Anaerolineae bacterium]|nr:glycosyltransferase family 39 protein [Anaerolineae bacterium]
MIERWQTWSDRRKAMMLLILLAIIYGTLAFGFLPRHVFFAGDEGEKVLVVASSVRSGDWWRVKFEYPGLAFDPEVEAFFSPWVRVVDGQPVPYHLSTMNFWNPPLYALFGVSGLYVLPLLAGVGLAWLAYHLARLMALPHPWVVIPLVGLTTPVFFYSLTTWDHMPTVFYSTLTVLLLARQARRRNSCEMATAGVLMGLGIWTRLEMYLFAPAALMAYFYVFRRQRGVWRSLIPTVLGFTAVMVGMVAQHVAVYGKFDLIAWNVRTASVAEDSPGASSLLEVARGLVFRQAQVLLALTVDGSELWLERVFLALAFAGTVLVFRLPRLQRHPLLTMGCALMQVIGTALAFVHSRLYTVVGLVPTLPLMALSLAHVSPQADKELPPSRLALELAATAAMLFLLLGLFLLPTFGGLTWGPRYLSELFPLLPVLAWATFWRVREAVDHADARRAVQIAFGLLAITSLVVQCVGVGILFDQKAKMVAWYTDLNELDVEFVLSDQQFYLQYMASLYFERIFLCPRTQAIYDRLAERLYEHGVGRFAWVPSEVSEVDPLIETPRFAVRQIRGYLHEIVPVAEGGG